MPRMTDVPKSPFENPDEAAWDTYLRDELTRLETVHGVQSAEELEVLHHIGKARHHVFPAEPNPFQHFSDAMNAEVLNRYQTHLNRLIMTKQSATMTEHADGVSGWLKYSKFSDPDMAKAVDRQFDIGLNLCIAADLGSSFWKRLGRQDRIGELNMIAQAQQHIMRKQQDIVWPPCTFDAYTSDENLVTDHKNPYYKPNENAPPYHTQGALSTDMRIFFACYADRDETADRDTAVQTLMHESMHRISRIWRNSPAQTGPYSPDKQLEIHSANLLHLFNDNADALKASVEPGNDAAEKARKAAQDIYLAAPEERQAIEHDRKTQRLQNGYQPDGKIIGHYCAWLSDDARFIPLIRRLQHYQSSPNIEYRYPFSAPDIA